MTFNYYRCDWVHQLDDEPVTIFYQVDAEGRVPRRIDVFADGRRACVSTKDFCGRENELPGFESLVEGSFYDDLDGLLDCGPVVDKDGSINLLTSDSDTFEADWRTYRLK
ncbi:DUF6881 domain-containing protein [Anderseniella sp. Alg231-50]|uniref:DUF6881 domain-containing protein n=1 Tax=Anderseniella sp. Alg231-50 TaxID=1922226 RepID=UPI000D5554FB